MSLSPEQLRALAELGYTSEDDLCRWRWMWQEEGNEFVERFIGYERKTAVVYQRWFPQLSNYVDDCRRKSPIPDLSDLTPTEREQHRILLSAMRKSMALNDTAFAPTPNCASILHTSRVGLPAAWKLFGDTGALILETSEQRRWFGEVYRWKEREEPWWFQSAWWKLSEAVPGEDSEYVARNYTLPAGCTFWCVQTGWGGGPLCGSGANDLWCWDGHTAKFVETYSAWNS